MSFLSKSQPSQSDSWKEKKHVKTRKDTTPFYFLRIIPSVISHSFDSHRFFCVVGVHKVRGEVVKILQQLQQIATFEEYKHWSCWIAVIIEYILISQWDYSYSCWFFSLRIICAQRILRRKRQGEHIFCIVSSLLWSYHCPPLHSNIQIQFVLQSHNESISHVSVVE